MIDRFWLIPLGVAAIFAIGIWNPDIGTAFWSYGKRKSPLAWRTIFVFGTTLLLGTSAYAFVDPHGSLAGAGITGCVTSLVFLVPWTALVLVPKRQGISPWGLIAKGLLWGPVLCAAFGGVCAAVDHEAVGPWFVGSAIFGLAAGPWTAAGAWADTLGVFRRRGKVKGAVGSSTHHTRVDPE
jgi:hypothetical protein